MNFKNKGVKMSVVKIVGVGHYCPENAVSNDQLASI